MIKYISGMVVFVAALGTAMAQTPIDSVMAQVSRNNKTLQSLKQYQSARELQLKTGLLPANPVIEYDFLAGTPANAGNQHDLSVIQAFDFPSVYVKKSQLAKQQSAQLEYGITAARQQVLLDARLICIALIYHNKLNLELSRQKQGTEKLLADLVSKMDRGDGNMLDVNKAKLRLIEVKKLDQENISAIAQLQERLASLNGGEALLFSDTVYFEHPAVPDFEQLETEYENADPVRKSKEHEKVVAQKQVELSKAAWLPGFELGYRYQGILGQQFNGFHTAVTLPFWEKKNTVKANQAAMLLADAEMEAHRNEHYFEIKELYERYRNLELTVSAYREVFSNDNNPVLLDKALRLGEISVIEYFWETTYYMESLRNYLLAEKAYQETVAELFKYRL